MNRPPFDVETDRRLDDTPTAASIRPILGNPHERGAAVAGHFTGDRTADRYLALYRSSVG